MTFRKFIGIWILVLIVGASQIYQQQSEQHAIDVRCNTPYAGQTKKLSQLAARPDFFEQLAEVIWHISNCQKKAPASDQGLRQIKYDRERI